MSQNTTVGSAFYFELDHDHSGAVYPFTDFRCVQEINLPPVTLQGYDHAVQNGYRGSPEEWIAQLNQHQP